ncbi:hypothetical protein PYW08_016379 [Mythimna loreyi]|uniref:Uncharacterized protein n=1 Tax=Mythimna loreyi TaxID=667449 RepID=A0ACC2QWU8_9NEOP|nr:hypothetical protein PYW08_016379 [Mythimna loreyi]
MMKNISDDVSSIKNEIRSLATEQTKIKSEIAELKISSSATNTKVSALENELKNIKATPISQNTENTITYEDAMAEFQERQARSKNIILVGVPEAKGSNKEDRMKCDIHEVTKILKAILPECPEPNMIRRLGNYKPETVRHIKVFLPSPDLAKTILRNKAMINLDPYKIFSDQTPYQQKFIKNLKQELHLRTENGEKDLIIKYVNGTPKIIRRTSKN